MDKKFKLAFNAIIVGFIFVTVLALANIMICSKLAGVGGFASFSRAVGMILLILAVLFNLSLIRVVAKSLSTSLVEPIREFEAGMASGAAEASKEQIDMLRQIEAGIEQITIVL